MREIGNITSKKRGNAKNVRTQKDALDAPESIMSSKNFKDWVRKIIAAKVIAIKMVAGTSDFKT